MSTTRRGFLQKSMLYGCSAAASPLLTPVTFAAAPSDNRLVVIILRGAMDGLDVVQPLGDKNFRTYRPKITGKGQFALDDYFALHPALGALGPLWRAGELAFAHAVSTPYRNKRSHFDGQDLLEAGRANVAEFREENSGWVNRLLEVLPGSTAQTAYAIGNEKLILMSGDAPVSNWAPGRTIPFSDTGRYLLSKIYQDDFLFAEAFAAAQRLGDRELKAIIEQRAFDEDEQLSMQDMMQMNSDASKSQKRAGALASYAAARLREEARIASFSIGGWDTHAGQKRRIPKVLGALQDAILTLKDELGPMWGKTAVLAMTEFGRTVRENGSGGTDHGTGGAMLMAGGALRGRHIYGKWPGLDAADLYQNRDLMPTMDVRSFAANAMRDLFGVSGHHLETVVFPGLSIEENPRFIL